MWQMSVHIVKYFAWRLIVFCFTVLYMLMDFTIFESYVSLLLQNRINPSSMVTGFLKYCQFYIKFRRKLHEVSRSFFLRRIPILVQLFVWSVVFDNRDGECWHEIRNKMSCITNTKTGRISENEKNITNNKSKKTDNCLAKIQLNNLYTKYSHNAENLKLSNTNPTKTCECAHEDKSHHGPLVALVVYNSMIIRHLKYIHMWSSATDIQLMSTN